MTDNISQETFMLVKNRLLEEKKRLMELLEDEKQQDPTVSDASYDRENTQDDDAFEREGKLRADALVKQTDEQLAEVNRALTKIDEGTYGVCDICGKPIDPARLEMIPEATLCINDKKNVE
jgi:DnaK suppressor protein